MRVPALSWHSALQYQKAEHSQQTLQRRHCRHFLWTTKAQLHQSSMRVMNVRVDKRAPSSARLPGPPSLVPRGAWQTRQPTAGPSVQDGPGGPPRQHGETALRSLQHTDAVDSPRMTPTSCRSLLRMANCKALWPLTAESQTRALAASRRSTRRGNCFTGRAQKTEARLASRLSLAWAANK